LRIDTLAVIPAKEVEYIPVCAGIGKQAVDENIHSEQRPPPSFDKPGESALGVAGAVAPTHPYASITCTM
jgi:hypothetical protein